MNIILIDVLTVLMKEIRYAARLLAYFEHQNKTHSLDHSKIQQHVYNQIWNRGNDDHILYIILKYTHVFDIYLGEPIRKWLTKSTSIYLCQIYYIEYFGFHFWFDMFSFFIIFIWLVMKDMKCCAWLLFISLNRCLMLKEKTIFRSECFSTTL